MTKMPLRIVYAALWISLPAPSQAVPAAVAATNWYVSPTGCDTANGHSPITALRTLQRAADATAPGDTVFVMDGTYTSDNYLVLGISRPGRPNAWINWRPYSGAKPILRGGALNWDVVRFMSTAAYISFSGFKIIGNDANVTLAQAQSAEGDPGHHPEVNGNCITVTNRGGTKAEHPHHITISNNIVSACPGGGISTIQADYITISGNTVFDNSWYSAYGTSGISTLSNFDTDPADRSTPYKFVITGNTVYGNQEFIPWLAYNPPTITDGEGIIIDSNKNSAYPGGHVDTPPYGGRTLIANNVVYANGSAAIEVFQSAHVDIVNNSTYGNVRTPVETGRGELNLNIATDVNAVNNIFESATGQNPFVLLSPCTGGCVFDYNLYFGGTNKIGGVEQGQHDIYADPLYTNPAAPRLGEVNLKLKQGSPAVGSGASKLAPSTDLDGNPRSAKIDRGAYQQ